MPPQTGAALERERGRKRNYSFIVFCVPKVIHVACGRLHTVALVEGQVDGTSRTTAYAWGLASNLVSGLCSLEAWRLLFPCMPDLCVRACVAGT